MGPTIAHTIPKTTNGRLMSKMGPRQSSAMAGESSLFTSSAWARAKPENINTVIITDAAIVPHLASVDELAENEWIPLSISEMGTGDFGTAVPDFYLSNPIARASSLMAELSMQSKAQKLDQVAAE